MNTRRVYAVYFLFLSVSFFLAARFFIISKNGSQAVDVLSGQYNRRMEIASRKGGVFDRNGQRIDSLTDGYITFVEPSAISESDALDMSLKFSKNGDQNQSYYFEKLLQRRPFVFLSTKDLTDDVCISFQKYKEREDEYLCHILGYRNSDGDGVCGIVGTYDEFLSLYSHGEVYAVFKADAHGIVIENEKAEIIDSEYSENYGVYLTIDHEIQKAVEEIAKESLDMGAVVVQNTKSGEMLAMVSAPTFTTDEIPDVLLSDKGELLNRCFLGYTPGSVFKTVVASAALSEDKSSYENVYKCTGEIDVGGQKIRCHNTSGHGDLDLKGAFAMSCNPYFINLGCSMGNEKIIEYAKLFGIGRYDSVNLMKMSSGNLPEENEDFVSVVANTSVGQGELLLTPVQVCSMISTAATGIYK